MRQRKKQRNQSVWKLAALLARQFIEKAGESQGFEQARSRDLPQLFQNATANPDGVAVRTAAWLTCAKGTAVSLRRNERKARSAERDDGARSFFPQEKRRSPAGATTQAVGQADPAPRDRVRVADKKKDRSSRGELARTFESSAFFRLACSDKPTQRRFSGVLEGRFYLKSGPSNVSPIISSCPPAAPCQS